MKSPGKSPGSLIMWGWGVTVAALIRTFSTWEHVPIDIEAHVRPEFLKMGVTAQVWFWPDPTLDPKIIRGSIELYEVPVHSEGSPEAWSNCEGSPEKWADITYAANQEHELQRLVCCKELLHLLDPVEHWVTRPEEVHRLIEKIVLPSDLQDPLTDGIHANTDRIAIIYAVAILFPLATRNLLMQPFLNGTLSLSQIAEMTELPIRYAALVMNEGWPELHEMLVALGTPSASTG